MTEDMLKTIANRMVNLWSYTRALEIIVVEQLGGNHQQLEELIKKAHETPEYQALCDQIFRELKGDQ